MIIKGNLPPDFGLSPTVITVGGGGGEIIGGGRGLPWLLPTIGGGGGDGGGVIGSGRGFAGSDGGGKPAGGLLELFWVGSII